MVWITGNRNTLDQWNENIVDTKQGMNFRNKNHIRMELTIHGSTHDSASDGDITQQFGSENQ